MADADPDADRERQVPRRDRRDSEQERCPSRPRYEAVDGRQGAQGLRVLVPCQATLALLTTRRRLRSWAFAGSPGDGAADHPALGGVVTVVGAVEDEVAQAGEVRLDAVHRAGVEGNVGQFGVVGGGPVADAAVGLGRQVRAEVVRYEDQADLGWVERADVAGEGEKLGASLAGV